MKVGIVGAGAMGSLFGGLLADAGHEVWLVDVWRAHIEAIADEGLRMTCDGRERVVQPRATTTASDAGEVDVVMFWCKGPSTADAAVGARPMLGEHTIACSLQNGLGNPEIIATVVPADRIVHGVTEIGATIRGPGHIELTPSAWDGSGATYVGTGNPASYPLAERIAELLSGATIGTTARRDVDAVVWEKLTINCPVAPAVAIARLPIGRVAGFAEMRPLIDGLCDEVVAVANAAGIPLDAEERRRHAFAVYEAVADHVSSMGGDVLARRPTEIDSLNGAIVREGARVGVPTPLNDTMARLVRLVEANYDGQLGVV